jgi:two-component system chemotaxis response regulator CheB
VSPIRTLVIDDSVFIREALIEACGADPDIEIAGTATNQLQALSLITSLRPDLIMLDLSLPGVSGTGTLAAIRNMAPDVPLILLSTFSELWARENGSLWWRGATEFIRKPVQAANSSEARRQFRRELARKIASMSAPSKVVAYQAPLATETETARGPFEVVGIGASTGGPEALTGLMAEMPKDFPVPILIVQHMPPTFTRHFAERLDGITPLLVKEGKSGQRLGPGQVWVAPGDQHMTVGRQGSDVVLMMNGRPREQGCRPSVDVLFRSMAQVFGNRALAVVLTGMGSDGTNGAQAIWEAGGEVIVQDQATSLIWGMPGRVVAAGLARIVCPLDSVAAAIMGRVYANREPEKSLHAALAR